MRGVRSLAVGVFVAALLAMPTVKATELIDSDESRTETLERLSHDSYKIVAQSGQQARIHVTAQEYDVDFYVFTQAQYSDYLNPTVENIGFVESEEKSRDFVYVSQSPEVTLVVDNDYVSQSGALPGQGNVTYTLEVTYSKIPEKSVIDALFFETCWGWLGLIILIAIGTSAWLYTAPKQHRETSRQLTEVLK